MKKLLFFLMAVFLAGMHLQAATSYGFSVGGVSVTSDNYTNVTGSDISGTVFYNPTTKYLFLENVTITRAGYGIYNESCSGLTVVFKGTCSLKGTNAPAIKLTANTTLEANSGSTVNLTGLTSNGEGIYMENNINLYLKGPGYFKITSEDADAITSGNSSTSNVYFQNNAKSYVCSYQGASIKNGTFHFDTGTITMLYNTPNNSPGSVISNSTIELYGAETIKNRVNVSMINNSLVYSYNGNPVKGNVLISDHADWWDTTDGAFFKIINSSDHTVEVTYATPEYNSYYSEPYIRDRVMIYGDNNVYYNIIGIGDYAFYKCTFLKSQGWIPGWSESSGKMNLTYIGSYAFAQCSGLTYVSIPSYITRVDRNAYGACDNVKSVDIPNGTIGDAAFGGCSSMKTLTLGSGVTSIGQNAFWGSSSLIMITSNATTPPIINSETFPDYNVPLWVPSTDVANSYSIANYWKNFYAIIPTTADVFDFCVNGIYYHKTSTNTVEVSYSTTNYGSYQRSGSDDYIEVPPTVTCNGVTYNVTGVRDNAFCNSTVGGGIFLPNSVTSIGARAFYHCKTPIVDHRPDLTYLGEEAFAYSEIVSANINMASIPNDAYNYCTQLSSIYLGENVTNIGSYAFYSCPLTTIDCSSLATPPTCQSSTFVYYTAKVIVPTPASILTYKAADVWKRFTNYQSRQSYDFISDGLYYAITSENTVSVVSHSITGDITIPATVTYNGTTYNVTAIGENAFNSSNPDNKLRSGGTTDITSVTMPTSITSIGNRAFYYCEGLTYIVLPSGVTSIGENAFEDCTALEYVFSYAVTPPTVENTTFSNLYSTAKLVVPNDKLNTYKAATYWKNFTNVETINTALTSAANYSGTSISFASDGDYPWRAEHVGDRTYVRSGNNGYHSTTSNMTAIVNVPSNADSATLSFDFKAWGEGTGTTFYDKCVFSVDGTAQFTYGARQNDWENYSVALTPGDHTLTWTYIKDGSMNKIGDYFAVDNVKLTVAITEAYACFTPSNTTLTFYYDNLRSTRTGTSYLLNTGTTQPGWYSVRSSITGVTFAPSFANARPTTTYYWFREMSNLTSITGISYLKTDSVTTMGHMFYGCSGLTSLDVSGFKTTNVTNMYGMFYGCSGLSSLNVSNFNTAKVTTMRGMFYGCSGLTRLDLNNFNTANVTNMGDMFTGCNKLTALDQRNFNTSKVTYMASMFSGCNKLTTLDLRSFSTSKVTNMSSMFNGCSALTTVYVDNSWSTAAVTTSTNMFTGCTSLVGGMGTTYNASHVDATYAHIDGGTSNPGYFTEMILEAYAVYTSANRTLTFYYDGQRNSRPGTKYLLNMSTNDPGWTASTASNVTQVVFDPSFADARPTSCYRWFYNMQNLTAISGMEYLNTSEVTTMGNMFSNCRQLTSLDVSHFNTSKVISMGGMFSNCRQLTSLDLSSFNTSKVQLMNSMFSNCTNLTTIYASSEWSTDAVTSSSNMFYSCTKLVGGMGTTYSSSHVDVAYAHIDGGTSNPGYFTDGESFMFIRGDVDGDGEVKIIDVSALINKLLIDSKTSADRADVNLDGKVTIADVTALISYLLSGTW